MNNWWNRNEAIPFTEKNFIKIIDFYQHRCPVIYRSGKRVANRGIDFKSKGWNSNSMKTLLCKMKKDNGYIIEYKCCEQGEKVEDVMKRIEKSSKSFVEAIVFKENKDIYKTQSIFYAIRNAFAHSSFSVKNIQGIGNVYYFESKKEKDVKSQICLRESTLLHWIDLFNKPYSISSNRKKYKKEGGRLKLAA